MIGKLTGVADEIEANYILLKTDGGVFYKIFLPAIVIRRLKPSETLTLYIHMHVRENEISLYGFETKDQLTIFNILIDIPNIGPKSAMNILGFNPVEKLVEAVKAQDGLYFSQIPGVGKKTAQKILLDLSSKFEVEFILPKKSFTEDDRALLEALVSLGFSRHEANKAMERIPREGKLEERITFALKNLNKNG